MRLLITGAAGNLGSHLARYALIGPHELTLLIHRRNPPLDVSASPKVTVHRGDLGDPRSLEGACRGVDCIVHFAGRLFAPRPERFLPRTNLEYVQNLVAAALPAGVKKFILISFPHVEGESFPDNPATGRLDGRPTSVHARTRLAAERHLFQACSGRAMTAVSLRAGMIYARGVLMLDAARWLLGHRLLAVWRRPTWIHLLALPDFLHCVMAAVEGTHVSGVYNLGDEEPLTLQEFLDALAAHWRFRTPWRLPAWIFFGAGLSCELFAVIFRTASPLTRDFIRIGMASYVSDTSRMKQELLSELEFPSLRKGLALL